MKLGCAFVCLAAGCGVTADDTTTTPPTPPPVVSAMSPTSGPYGTEVTITGSGFGSGALLEQLLFQDSSPYTSVPGYDDGCGFVVDAWIDTSIAARVTFPCTTGSIVVRTAGGMATAGTFTTTGGWNAGPGLDIEELVESRVTSTGVLAGLYRQYYMANGGPGLAVFDGDDAGAYALPGVAGNAGSDAPLDAHMVEADDHTPEVIATVSDGTVSVFALQGTSLVATSTGMIGRVMAAARDDAGVYAWIDSASGLSRVRPGTPWVVDRGPFGPADPPLEAAVAADGTLWISFSEPNSDPFDYEGYISLQSLGPTASELSPIERADPNSYDDFISQAHIVLAADGVHVVVVAYAEDNGTGIETALAPRQRTAAQTWIDAPLPPGLVQYAFAGTTLAAAVNNPDGTTALVPDVTAPSATEIMPVWPETAEGLAVDASGALRPLLGGNVVYGPVPPSP